MFKRTVALVMVLCLALSATCFGAATEPSEWAKAELDDSLVSLLEGLKVEMNYQRPITREEFCYLAVSAYTTLVGDDMPDLSVDNPFVDVDHPFILMAYGLGIVKGISDTEFAPDKEVTRQEMCVMLARVLSAVKPDVASADALAASIGALDKFDDASDVADWAAESVGFAVANGIMNGMSATAIGPKGNCTVEQAIVLVGRMIKNMK